MTRAIHFSLTYWTSTTNGGVFVRICPTYLSRHSDELSWSVARESHAQLSNYTATFRQWGDGPPLVLIPGMAGGIDLVAPLAELLARRFRVIAYQLRGEEDCFALRRRFGVADLARDLAEFIEWQGLERPQVLGVSFGGVVGLEYAARYPNRLAGLCVQGVGARLESNLVKLIAGMVLSGYPLPADNPFVNQFFRLLFGRKPQSGALLDFVVRHCWQTDQSVMTHRFRLVRRHDLRPRLSRVQTPVLVMSAPRDVFVSDASLLELCGGLEDTRFVRLQRGGHLAFLVEAERVAREVMDFCDES
ncbi:MAG: alpha/beta fold hydrolase [Gemmataceae bacterium]